MMQAEAASTRALHRAVSTQTMLQCLVVVDLDSLEVPFLKQSPNHKAGESWGARSGCTVAIGL